MFGLLDFFYLFFNHSQPLWLKNEMHPMDIVDFFNIFKHVHIRSLLKLTDKGDVLI